MDGLLRESSGLLLLVLIGAFLTTCVHHLFTYLSDRKQKVSLIFAIWIFVGLNHHMLGLAYYLDGWDFAFRTSAINILILVESYISTSLLLFILYGKLSKYQALLISLTLFTIVLGLLLPEVRPELHFSTRLIFFILKLYFLYLLWQSGKPSFGLLITGSLLYSLTIAFFGSGPLSIRQDYPELSQIVVILSYVVSINMYSAYLARLAALASLKHAETEITARNLVAVDQMKTRFFSNITHEFRTPLTLIQGPARELELKARDEESKHMAGIIQRNAVRLLKLINQLLDLAKLDAHEMRLQPKPIALLAFLRTIHAQFLSSAQSKGVELNLRADSELPNVTADPEKLESIVFNLLSNAIKFTKRGGKVELHARYQSGCLQLQVQDTGGGIDPGKLNRIFDRFYQVSPTDASHAEGTGIGLALVKEYTELMRGIIRVESEVGRGTSFEIELPLTLAEPGLIASESESPVKITEILPDTSPEDLPLVLLVEDNDEIRTFIRTCLGTNFRYAEAADGKEGLALAQESIPDLLISDWMMPGMDGLEFCHRIKSDKRTDHIPFIMLTAKAARENRLEGLKTGADEYLIKPFDREELIIKVQNLLTLRENLRSHLRLTQLSEGTRVQPVSAEEEFVSAAREFVEQRMAEEQLSVDEMAREMTLSREQLYRKLMALTGLAPSAFIRKLRLQRAAQLLAARADTVSQVAYSIGFGNLSHFSKVFKEEYGVSPSEFADADIKNP